MAIELRKEDIEPLMEGLAILGTGGGGNPAIGKAILENDLARGRKIIIVDPSEVPDNALVVSGGIMGSVKVLDAMNIGDLISKWETRFELIEATRSMEKYMGKKVEYVVPFEVGGLNTPVILSLAARLGISAVDGDALGRSAPETQMTSFIGHGVSLTPMPLVDAQGNTIIVAQQCEPVFADEIGRWMITRGGGMGANTHYPMNGKQLKECVVPRTISKAMDIGRAILSAKEAKADPVRAAIEALGGKELFRGRVSRVEGEDKGGFYVTTVLMAGWGSYSGMEARMVIKNETMALWINGEIKAIFPDLVCMLDPDSGKGVLSTAVEAGRDLVLVGTPCHVRLRASLNNPRTAPAFGGARYGHPEIKYIPIEELNR
ncbi:DUF917 domain-containing protein [Moorellaceae bacterium AZ2]